MKMPNPVCKLSVPRSFPVVLSMFLMACSQVGTVKSVGIYLEDISESLGTTPTDIGIALGLFTAFSYFPAPLVVALYRLRSIRRVILIMGSCLIPLGVILTALATSNALIAVYLSMSGVGHCMLGIASTLALEQCASNKNFNLLFGVGMGGFGLGMVLLPFLADILGQIYGWRGGLLILGSLMTNVVPCTMAIQVEQQWECSETTDQRSIINDSPDIDQLPEKLCKDYPTIEEEKITLYSQDTSGSDLSLSKHQLLPEYDKATNFQAISQIRTEYDDQHSQERPIIERLLECIRLSDFYRDPALNFIFVASVMCGALYCGWHAFLVPHAIQRGYSMRSIILMTLFASVGNFVGRVMAGVLSSRLANPIVLFIVAALLNAFIILCDAFLHSYYVLTVTACLSSILIAAMSVLDTLVIKKRASPASFDVAYAVNEQSFGLGTFLGGYLSGLVGEHFSSYDASFKLLAGVEIMVFLLMLPLLFKKPVNA